MCLSGDLDSTVVKTWRLFDLLEDEMLSEHGLRSAASTSSDFADRLVRLFQKRVAFLRLRYY